MIPFNKPFISGNELEYIAQAVSAGKISGNGAFTGKCHAWFREKFGFPHVLLTTSGTAALEMAAILLDIGPGDEVIMPSFTFVSTANAFVLRGAKIVFADSGSEEPNIDVHTLETLVTPKTKAVVVTHYAGVACDMDPILSLAEKYHLFVVEDAAHAIGSTYKGRPLGSLGHLAAFSFHETKNIFCGEGGMLVVNDPQFAGRAEIIWEKGTNRSAFFRGETDKYTWVDIGSSFLPSEILAAFLFAQLEQYDLIQSKRMELWNCYRRNLSTGAFPGQYGLPVIPPYAGHNAHMFYLLCPDEGSRNALIDKLRAQDIMAVFHYQPLHLSPFYTSRHDGRKLPECERYATTLLRLPLFYLLSAGSVKEISSAVTAAGFV